MLRDVAVVVGNVVENIIVVDDGESGRAFLVSEHAPCGCVDFDGKVISVPASFVDVTDLPAGERPGLGWKVGGEKGSELAAALKEVAEKGDLAPIKAIVGREEPFAEPKSHDWIFEAEEVPAEEGKGAGE